MSRTTGRQETLAASTRVATGDYDRSFVRRDLFATIRLSGFIVENNMLLRPFLTAAACPGTPAVGRASANIAVTGAFNA